MGLDDQNDTTDVSTRNAACAEAGCKVRAVCMPFHRVRSPANAMSTNIAYWPHITHRIQQCLRDPVVKNVPTSVPVNWTDRITVQLNTSAF